MIETDLESIHKVREAPDEVSFLIASKAMSRGVEYKYCLQEGRFYIYKEGYWKQIHELEILQIISRDERISQYSCSTTKNIIERLKFLTQTNLTSFNWSEMLNLEDGMINPYDGEISEHSSTYYSTIRIPYKYTNETKCELWIKTINEILEGDQSKINTIQEFFGYCLTRDVRQEKALLLLGESRSGKSTILHTLQHMVGDKNCAALPLKYFTNPQYTSMMVNKLVTFDKDVSKKAQDFEEDFKKIVSGEEISSNDKYVAPFRFNPYCKVVLSANEFPRITDHSSAFYNRLILIPCDRVFKPEEQNRNLRDDLLKELPEILNWSIAGLKRLNKRGYFEQLEFMKRAVEELEDENNPVNIFCKEKIEVAPGEEIEKGECFNKYKQWCMDNKNYIMSHSRFSAAFFKVFHKETFKDTQSITNKKRVWKNLRFKLNLGTDVGYEKE